MGIKARRNDGLPSVRGRKVKVNRGSNRRGGGGGGSSYEENYEKNQHNNSFMNYFGCGNRVWYLTVSIIIVVCVYVSKTHTTTDEASDLVTVPSPALVVDVVPASVPDAVPVPVPVPVPAVPVPVPATPVVPQPAVPVPVPVPVTPVVPQPAVVVATEPSFPATCTDTQLQQVSQQLPDDHCSRYWNPNCSIRVATSGCQNPIIAREFFANTNEFTPSSPFTGVVLGWFENSVPIDMLSIGSGLDPKYDNVNEWNKHLKTSYSACRTPLTTKEGNKPRSPVLAPQVFVVNWNNKKWDSPPSGISLQELKMKYGDYSDKELMIEDIKMDEYTGKKDSFTQLIQSKLGQQQPMIHYLDLVRGDGLDYTILMELVPELLKNVRFLTFEYNKVSKWLSPSFKLLDLITNLRKNGLVCYWSGDDKAEYGLWRITDCFLNHYNTDTKHWARIQCVSNTHNDVKVLATRMETKFLETIQKKDFVFGGSRRLGMEERK